MTCRNRGLLRLFGLFLVLVLVIGTAGPAWAQKDEPEPKPEPGEEKKEEKAEDEKGDEDSKPADEKKKKKKDSKIKPYDEVITEDAKTEVGFFRTHRVKDKLYFEIPPDAFGRELVWVAQIEQTTAGSSYAGMPISDHVVRWEEVGERVLLRKVRYDIRADTDDPIALAVTASNLAPIIRSFDVTAYGKDKAPVIDVTELYIKDVAEFSARRSLGSGAMDSKRSFVENVSVFPENIEISVTGSFAPGKPPTIPGIPRRPGSDIPRSSGISAVLHHSMVLLPDNLMQPRKLDRRVGFFSEGFTDFADNDDHEAEAVRYITRWRLEKKKPNAKLSKPVKPIVFYVGRGTPEKWKPYVKAGIEMWQTAFESAGFKEAIIGEYAPDPIDDPDWDAEDARYSVIRWLPSAIENAFGPHVADPRTGEILEADVRMYHNVQKLLRDWYFVQAAASDERAQQLPMPDELMGELIQFVVAHEVGHSLGLPHNMKASSSYTIEQLRDPEWTKANGTAPSIMDYARFNYVAQPEDNAGLMPGIGPYDHFSVDWGYRQYKDAEAEEEGLRALVAKQVDDPMLRFGNPNPRNDSTQQTEDLGSDAVAATELGLKNLERIAGFLVKATSKPDENYDLLENMYGEVMGQWMREMGHVTNVVGGIRQDNLYYGDADSRFSPNDADYQRRAVAFLIENALQTPEMFIDPDILLRITDEGAASRIQGAQRRLIGLLVNTDRLNRMAEFTADGNGYTPVELLADLRAGIFKEIKAGEPVDLYRRNLQRSYVDHLGGSLIKPRANSDLPALARAELMAMSAMLESTSSADAMTQAHLIDLASRTERWLEADPAEASGGSGRGFQVEDEWRIRGCWER
jgi:hypothetical protein